MTSSFKTSIAAIKHYLNIYRRWPYWNRENCIFIHIPKAAGTSINHALYGRTLGHYSIAEIQNHFPGLVEKSFVFSVARNPYDRLVSAYHFAKKGKTADMGMKNPEQYQIHEFRTFESFVLEWLVQQNIETIDHVFRPQYLYVCQNGRLAVNYLGHLESLGNDIKVVENRLGRQLLIEEKNAVPKSASYDTFYNDNLLEVVYKIYQKDFELLGYNKTDN